MADEEPCSWRDRQGDVWRLGVDGLLHTPETRPFPREYVEKKWGPLQQVQAMLDGGPVQRMIREQVRRNDAVIEEACWVMLRQTGTQYGVLVETNTNGTVTATLTPEVPYAEIHYAPTQWGVGPFHSEENQP